MSPGKWRPFCLGLNVLNSVCSPMKKVGLDFLKNTSLGRDVIPYSFAIVGWLNLTASNSEKKKSSIVILSMIIDEGCNEECYDKKLWWRYHILIPIIIFTDLYTNQSQEWSIMLQGQWTYFISCSTEFDLGDIKIYLHFLSFPNGEMVQVVQILPSEIQGTIYPA